MSIYKEELHKIILDEFFLKKVAVTIYHCRDNYNTIPDYPPIDTNEAAYQVALLVKKELVAQEFFKSFLKEAFDAGFTAYPCAKTAFDDWYKSLK